MSKYNWKKHRLYTPYRNPEVMAQRIRDKDAEELRIILTADNREQALRNYIHRLLGIDGEIQVVQTP